MTRAADRLDNLSNFLAYADFVPVVSLASGIVHVICAIRDRVMGELPLSDPTQQTASQFAKYKLDNWSHLKKGLLALIPFVGNMILLKKHYASQFNQSRPIEEWPSSLLADAAFAEKAIREGNRAVYSHASLDRATSLSLYRDDKIDLPSNLAHDPEFAVIQVGRNSDDFSRLSPILKDNVEVINAALTALTNEDSSQEIIAILSQVSPEVVTQNPPLEVRLKEAAKAMVGVYTLTNFAALPLKQKTHPEVVQEGIMALRENTVEIIALIKQATLAARELKGRTPEGDELVKAILGVAPECAFEDSLLKNSAIHFGLRAANIIDGVKDMFCAIIN